MENRASHAEKAYETALRTASFTRLSRRSSVSHRNRLRPCDVGLESLIKLEVGVRLGGGTSASGVLNADGLVHMRTHRKGEPSNLVRL